MIATNKLPSSVLIIFLFWYGVFFLPLGLRGIPIWDILQNLPISVALSLAGAVVGLGMVMMTTITVSAADEDRLWEGSVNREAHVSLGAAAWCPVPKRAAAPRDLLESTPWWPRVSTQYPGYASAIKAVLDTMYVTPKLPASPYPGGHRGRTLVEHSLAVVEHMLQEVPGWRYTGQYDKRGNLRVPLQNPDKIAHRFRPDEVPLLILAALSHDIGKLTCYVPAEDQDDNLTVATLKVVEAFPNHDQEGARLLRMIPEVMDLPFEDRTALITACGYYHHPFQLPNADWVTDRIRSLTELLAHADIQTGISEGHTLTADVEDGYADTVEPAAPSADALPPTEELDEGDLDSAISVAASEIRGARKSRGEAEHGQQVDLPRELRLFMDSIRRPGAINGVGQQKNNRIAWKHGDYVYVIDSAMRAVVMNRNPGDMAWLATATETSSGNAAPFTAALAEQIHAMNGLMVEFEGKTYTPRRALFKMASKGSTRTVPVLVVRTSFIPGANGIKDADPIKLTGPFWGDQSGRSLEPRDGEAASVTESAIEATDVADLSVDTSGAAAISTEHTPASTSQPVEDEADQEDSVEEQALDDPHLAAARRHFSAEALDAEDLGIDLPTAPPVVSDSGDEILDHQSTSKPEVRASSPSSEEVAAYFVEMIQSIEFLDRHSYAIRERGGVRFALLPLDEESGQAVSRALDELRHIGADLSGIKVATIEATNQRAYVFRLPA